MMTTFNTLLGGTVHNRIGKALTSDVIEGPRWHVGIYLEQFGDKMNECNFRAVVVGGPILHMYAGGWVRHNICVSVWGRQRELFDHSQAAILTKLQSKNKLFVKCEVELFSVAC